MYNIVVTNYEITFRINRGEYMDPNSTDQTQTQGDGTQPIQPSVPAPSADPTPDPTQPLTPDTPTQPAGDDVAGQQVPPAAPAPDASTTPEQPAAGGLPGVENAQVVEPPASQPGPEVATDMNTPADKPVETPGDNPGQAPSPDQNQQFGSF